MLNSQCHIPRHSKQLFQGSAWQWHAPAAQLEETCSPAAAAAAPWQAGQQCSSNADAAAMLMQAAATPHTPLTLLQENLHTCPCFSERGCNNPLEDNFSVGAIKMRSLTGHHHLLPEPQP